MWARVSLYASGGRPCWARTSLISRATSRDQSATLAGGGATGALVGVGAGLFAYPVLDEGFAQAQQDFAADSDEPTSG